jgi:hypothetical protein
MPRPGRLFVRLLVLRKYDPSAGTTRMFDDAKPRTQLGEL